MSDDYLWDGTGEPDPEIQRLERALRPLRLDGPPPLRVPPRVPVRLAPAFLTFAAAAGLVLAITAPWAGAPSAWRVTSLSGTPRIDGEGIEGQGRLHVGDWLETDASAQARIAVGRIGEVEIAPRTRVGLLDAGQRQHRLSLRRGLMRARIWAPPGQFSVDTPAATAVDLGCAYTLEVDDTGAGQLVVERGWVGFEWQGRESFVPEGARCLTRPGIGPGTPYRTTTSDALARSLAILDFGPGDAVARSAALKRVLDESLPGDAFTLWHLLSRVPDAERGAVYERLAALAPPPAGVRREAALRGDREALDAWWDALGLGSASWWRRWKQPAPPLPTAPAPTS